MGLFRNLRATLKREVERKLAESLTLEEKYPMPTFHGIGTQIQWTDADSVTKAGGPVYRWPN